MKVGSHMTDLINSFTIQERNWAPEQGFAHTLLGLQDLHFAWPGYEAQGVEGKLKLRAAANESRAHFLVVPIPAELHGQHVRVRIPLQREGWQRGSGECPNAVRERGGQDVSGTRGSPCELSGESGFSKSTEEAVCLLRCLSSTQTLCLELPAHFS